MAPEKCRHGLKGLDAEDHLSDVTFLLSASTQTDFCNSIQLKKIKYHLVIEIKLQLKVYETICKYIAINLTDVQTQRKFH